MRIHFIVPGSCALMMSCALSNSIFRTFSIQTENGNLADSIAIDAKQRVVLATKMKKHRIIPTPDGGKIDDRGEWSVVCAEPSPDAFSTIAQSLSGKLNVQDAGAFEMAFGQSETGAYIGLRTQTIQLLRDGMYRLCEGYMSGALDEVSFKSLQRRYQNLMMGLLAVEQLTGAIVAPQVALTSAVAKASTAARNQNPKQRLDEYNAAKDNAENANNELTAAQKAVNDQKDIYNKAGNDEKGAEQTKLKSLQDTLVQKQRLKEKADFDAEYLKRALDGQFSGVSASTLASAAQWNAVASEKTNANFVDIAKTVKEIVAQVVNESFHDESCIDLLNIINSDVNARLSKDDPNIQLVSNYCSALTNRLVLQNKAAERTLKQIQIVQEYQDKIKSESKKEVRDMLIQQMEGSKDFMKSIQYLQQFP